MNLEYLFSPTKQFTYPSGKLLDGGKIFVYLKDTTNLATLYSPDGSFVSNPILLDANGRASVRADVSYQYRLEVYTNKDVLLYTCEAFCEGSGSGGFSFVIHDETLSGNGTTSSPLGVFNIPFAVDETMTAYEGIVEGENALVVGVNSAWLNDKLGQELAGKVDRTEFEDCCSAVNEALENKLDASAFDLSNYYNKQETNNLLDQRVDRSEFAQTMNWVDQTKQDKLTFGYDGNSAISSINSSALRGGNGSCPWISGGKEIAEAQTLMPNTYFQVLSSFTVSGDHNHFISVKGGIYRFPNEWELGSAIATTNFFMPQSSMSGYLSLVAFSSYTASIDNNLTNNWAYTNSAYSLSLSNFYNKLDASAFSAWSAVQDPVLIGGSNITATSSKVDNHTQWNLAVNATPVVTDTKLIGDNCVTAHTTETSGEWIVGLVQSAYEAIDSVGGIATDVDTLKNASGNYYPLTGNPSGFLTAHQTVPSAKWESASNVVQTNSAQWAKNDGNTAVNNWVQHNSANCVSTNNSVNTNSSNWNSTYSTVFNNSANWGQGTSFPITSQVGSTKYTLNASSNGVWLTTASGPAGATTVLDAKGVQYQAYPSTDISASWYNIIRNANNATNTYCIVLNSTMTSVDLANYSAYDKVTVIHGQEGGPDYHLYWDGKTKVIYSGVYCDLGKVKDNHNRVKWTFLNSGWTNDNLWDWD